MEMLGDRRSEGKLGANIDSSLGLQVSGSVLFISTLILRISF